MEDTKDSRLIPTYKHKMQLTFPNEEIATTIYKALSVDDVIRQEHCYRDMRVEGNVLHVEFGAKLLKFLRVASSSFLEDCKLCVRTISVFG